MWANRSGRSPKMSYVSKSLRSLTKMSNHEQFAQVAHQKWGTLSESLRSLTKMGKWANRLFFWANCSFAHCFTKCKRFLQKTDERIPSPAKQQPFLLSLFFFYGHIYPNKSTPMLLTKGDFFWCVRTWPSQLKIKDAIFYYRIIKPVSGHSLKHQKVGFIYIKCIFVRKPKHLCLKI